MAYPIQMGLDPSHQLTEQELPDNIGHIWKDLARDLCFLQSTIDAMEKEKGGCAKECFIELVIVRWMRQKAIEATAGKLAEALERIGLKNLADDCISKLLTYPIQMGLDPSHQLTEQDIHDSKLPDNIGLKWKDLARDRGFNESTIDTIEKEKGGCAKECFIELLIVRWMRLKGMEATAGKLAEALERIGLKNLADNLMQGLSCCRCNCKSQGRRVDAKEANEPHVHQVDKCDKMICEMSDKLRASLREENNKCDKMICEMSNKLREEFSKMSSRIEELEEQLSVFSQKCQETEQEVSRKGIRIEQLEEELSIARQNCHEAEQQEDDFSTGTAQAAREYRVGVQLKKIREKLHEDVTSLLQMSEVKVKLDLLTKLSERLQNLYSDIQAMIADTCICSEDLKRDFCDFAYYGLRAEHNDLVHRVEDLESAQKGMSEEEKKALKKLQGFQVNRQEQVDILDKLEGLFKLPERLPKAPMSESFAADKQSNGKKVKRHTDPGARPMKPNTREEVTAPTTSNDGKSDKVCLNIMGQNSKFETLRSRFRRKESDKNQCFGVSYTPRRDS